MFRHSNTDPCPVCLGAQVKRKIGGLEDKCTHCAGSGRVNKPKSAAKGMFKKKIEQVPIVARIEIGEPITDLRAKDCEYAASEQTAHSETQIKTKVKANGKAKSWSRKKKSA